VRRFVVALAVMAMGAYAPSANAASPTIDSLNTITIDGHFKESRPGSGPPPLCFNGEPGGIGKLRGLGNACELWTFESFDGYDANGCVMVTGTDTFWLDDAQGSSFTEREHDTACHPGKMQDAPGQQTHAWGYPGADTGTWSFVSGSGTGIFANVCSGEGTLSLRFAGRTGIPTYTGTVSGC
jgi:hypothetical protein